LVFPTHSTTVLPFTSLRLVTVMGNKTRTTPSRPHNRDANGGTQQAEYPVVKGSGIPVPVPVEASSMSGWEGPVDRTVCAEKHVLGRNWTATVDVPRESVLENRGKAQF
jgi:hypothetical protein